MRSSLKIVVWSLLVLSAGPVAAQDAAFMFRLPLDRFPVIPHERGVTFFYGEWEPAGRSGGGVRTVSDGKIVVKDTGAVTPFRVLSAGKNFVLLTSLIRYETVWTNFTIFVLQSDSTSDPNDSNMITWYCNDSSMDGGEHAFAWSKQRLLNLFAVTCGKSIGKSETWWFGQGWSAIRYARPVN